MALKEFAAVPYIPLLCVRPAEMRALEELPDRSKDLMLPYMFLKGWATAHYLDSALSRIEDAYNKRPIILDLDPDTSASGARRPVHDELATLRDPTNGYKAWTDFVSARHNMIPSLQLTTDQAQMALQIQRFAELERGIVVRVPESAFLGVPGLAEDIAKNAPNSEVCFVLDYEEATRDILNRQAIAISTASRVLEKIPNCFISISASSFPTDFVGKVRQEIYERDFFNGLLSLLPSGQAIYSDRGSARAKQQNGGSGSPTPRIDFAGTGLWSFFRQEVAEGEDTIDAYVTAAKRAMADVCWDSKLKVWGTQMIERTALGDDEAIVSPMRSTAARINIHLQQQLYYSLPDDRYDTEEDWED